MELDIDYVLKNKEKLKSNKWLLVSSLQKSIRRGFFEDAKIIWDVVKELDKFHATYRTSIIAIEDIGLGNENLVHDFLSTSLKKANLSEKGGDDYIKKIIEDLALSTKDRSACDATWLASKLDWSKSFSNDFLKEFYKDESNDFIERVLAGWLLVGTKKIKHNFISERDEISNIEDFIELNRIMGVDEKTLEVVSASYPYQKEPHIFAYPLLKIKLEKEKGMTLGKYITGDSFSKKINKDIYWNHGIPILYAAVDGHTSEGKRIIERIKDYPEISNLIKDTSENSKLYLLKHALFKAEGQIVNKRLFYPTASNIYRSSQNFYVDGKTNVSKLIDCIEKMLPEINDMRTRALDYSFSEKKQFKSQ